MTQKKDEVDVHHLGQKGSKQLADAIRKGIEKGKKEAEQKKQDLPFVPDTDA